MQQQLFCGEFKANRALVGYFMSLIVTSSDVASMPCTMETDQSLLSSTLHSINALSPSHTA